MRRQCLRSSRQCFSFPPQPAGPLAQAPERGGFIVRLGNDTVAVERFSRTRTQLEGDVVSRSPQNRIVHYVATLGPTGRITRFESAMHPGAAGLAGPRSRAASSPWPATPPPCSSTPRAATRR